MLTMKPMPKQTPSRPMPLPKTPIKTPFPIQTPTRPMPLPKTGTSKVGTTNPSQKTKMANKIKK